MKIRNLFIAGVIAWMCIDCQSREKQVSPLQRAEKIFLAGDFKKLNAMADSLAALFPTDSVQIAQMDSLKEMARRIILDFSLTAEEVEERIERLMGAYSPEKMKEWEERGWLEWRIIDGEKRYFNRAASNLKLIMEHHRRMESDSTIIVPDKTALFRMDHAGKVITSGCNGKPVHPVGIHIRYSLTVDPDAVPPGETIRCWLPFPHESHPRQQDVSLISTFPAAYYLAPDSVPQRSLYLEQQAMEGKPVRFEMELSFISYAQYFNLKEISILPYQKDSPLYRKYTAEEKPHLLFTGEVRKLSESVVEGETNPVEIVRKIFYWIDENIPWAGALEYSTMPDIPGYVIHNRHGDCGMQTLLFMVLARYNGIPVKWQSGWMLPPGGVNLHDWCEVYFEGPGWVPLDMSYGRLPSGDPEISNFYISGIDAYRMIVNDATGGQFDPPKKHLRSETVDFQRGEVEWRGGNLYFDKWSYKMEVEYFNQK
jgi:transglutaminase-like putative cysteine protease